MTLTGLIRHLFQDELASGMIWLLMVYLSPVWPTTQGRYLISKTFRERQHPRPTGIKKMRTLDECGHFHYTDVIMTTMAFQITNITVVYSTVYSDADQRKHQSSASQAFVWGIHRDRWIPRTKGQLCGKCFHLMTSPCIHWAASW